MASCSKAGNVTLILSNLLLLDKVSTTHLPLSLSLLFFFLFICSGLITEVIDYLANCSENEACSARFFFPEIFCSTPSDSLAIAISGALCWWQWVLCWGFSDSRFISMCLTISPQIGLTCSHGEASLHTYKSVERCFTVEVLCGNQEWREICNKEIEMVAATKFLPGKVQRSVLFKHMEKDGRCTHSFPRGNLGDDVTARSAMAVCSALEVFFHHSDNWNMTSNWKSITMWVCSVKPSSCSVLQINGSADV